MTWLVLMESVYSWVLMKFLPCAAVPVAHLYPCHRPAANILWLTSSNRTSVWNKRFRTMSDIATHDHNLQYLPHFTPSISANSCEDKLGLFHEFRQQFTKYYPPLHLSLCENQPQYSHLQSYTQPLIISLEFSSGITASFCIIRYLLWSYM